MDVGWNVDGKTQEDRNLDDAEDEERHKLMSFVTYIQGQQAPWQRNRDVQAERQVSRVDRVLPVHRQLEVNRYAPPGTRLRRSSQTTQRRPALCASDLMTSPVITLTLGGSIQKAIDLFEQGKIHHLPVINTRGEIRGMLCEREVWRKRGKKKDHGQKVEDYMHDDVLAALPHTEIREIAAAMVQEKIRSLPIVSTEGALIGILTDTDILGCLVNQAPLDLWV